MRLVGLYDSPYVRRVAVAMQILGMPYEHVALSVFRHVDEMRTINPLIKVPMLELDNGERMIDSHFILDYLDGEVAPEKRLLPPHGSERRRLQQLCAAALVAAEKAVQVFYDAQLQSTALAKVTWVARCAQQMHDAFGELETHMDFDAIDGAPINLADITVAVAIRFAHFVAPDQFKQAQYPKLEKLSAYCENLPAFLAVPLE